MDRILADLDGWKADGEIPAKHVESIRSRIGYVLTTIHGKLRAVTQPIFHASQSDDALVQWNPDLEVMRAFLHTLFTSAHLPPRRFDITPRANDLSHVLEYTDSNGKGELGLVMIDLASRPPLKLYASAVIPPWFMDIVRLSDKLVWINQFEAFAVVVADLTFARYTAGRRVYHFVDNIAALGAIVNGYSGKPELAALVNLTSLFCVRNRTLKFYEYVQSAANCSDLPSRPRPCPQHQDEALWTSEERDAIRAWDLKYAHQWSACFHDMRFLSPDEVILPSREDFFDPVGVLSRSLGPV